MKTMFNADDVLTVVGRMAEEIASHRLLEFVVAERYQREYRALLNVLDRMGIEFRSAVITKHKAAAEKYGLNFPKEPEEFMKAWESMADTFACMFEEYFNYAMSTAKAMLHPQAKFNLTRDEHYFFLWHLTMQTEDGQTKTINIAPRWYPISLVEAKQ